MDISTIDFFGVALEFAALLALSGGLYLTVRHFRLRRTLVYMERFNNPGMIEVRTAVDKWLQSSTNNEERIKQVNEDLELKSKVMAFMNLMSEVGYAYRYGLLNRRVALDVWDILIPEYWSDMKFYVQYNRENGREIGHAFEEIAEVIISGLKDGV